MVNQIAKHILINTGQELDFADILNTVGQGILVTGKGAS